MADYSSLPGDWFEGLDVLYGGGPGDYGLSIPNAAGEAGIFPQMSPADADPETGDARTVLFAIVEQIWEKYSGFTPATLPEKMVISRSEAETDLYYNRIYRFTCQATVAEQDITEEGEEPEKVAYSNKPGDWFPGWDVTYNAETEQYDLTIEDAFGEGGTFPEMSDTEAYPDSGDIRKVLFAALEKVFSVWNSTTEATRPTAISLRKVANLSGNEITCYYFIRFRVDLITGDLIAEPA